MKGKCKLEVRKKRSLKESQETTVDPVLAALDEIEFEDDHQYQSKRSKKDEVRSSFGRWSSEEEISLKKNDDADKEMRSVHSDD